MAWLAGLDQILKQSSGWMTYKRGMEYFRDHRVKTIRFDPDEMTFRALVEGGEPYEVILQTDMDGRLSRVDCTCPAFASVAGHCKHIVAALLQLREEMRLSDFPPKQDPHEKTIREIIGLFQPALPEENHTTAAPLQVEYLLELIPSWNRKTDRWLTLRLKAGPKRLYVVKNIREFLSAFAEGKPLYFTKNFTYDPAVHLPDQKDREMLRFLASLCKSEQMYQQMLHPWDPPAEKNERQLTIPPDQIVTLLQHLPTGRFCLENDGDSYTELPVIEGESPVSFSLNREGEEYVLEPEVREKREGPVLLSEDGICFHAGRIYKLNQAQRENILPLYRRIRQLPEEKLYIPAIRMESFSSAVLPALKREGRLTIQRDVSDRMVQHPLRTEIHLDYKRDTDHGERLTARITHIYGEITVDPLMRDGQKKDGIVLLRDAEKEQQVMAVFEEVGFKFNGRELYLNDEAALFRFIHDKMPQLEEMADLYTTPALRDILFEPGRRPVPHVDVDTSTDWLEVRFELPDADPDELEKMLRAMIERKRYYRLQSGAFVSLEPPGVDSFRSLLEEGARRRDFIDGDRLKLPAARALQLEELLEQPAPDIKLGHRFRRLIRNIQDPENLDFSPPASLAPVLRDYQRFGFQWLKTLAHYRFGGILADDMGLGKTLQALTFILSELEEDSDGRAGPALVVSPASLIYNWEKECTRFAPGLKAVVIAGNREERERLLQDLTDFDLLITSYPLLRRDLELYDSHRFRTLILDEAQSFKNQHSRTAQAVRRISSRTRFALSGTPIENSLDELGSIMEVVMPGLFSGRQALRGLPTEEVARQVRPFILRRMKRDVLTELPEKIESIQLSELTTQQKRLYMATLQQLQQETELALKTEGFQKSRMKILAGLTRLRQICCHPSLYLANYTADSGKFAQLLEKLDELLQNRRRVLIFSQFTGMLALIRGELEKRGIPYHYLDGSTPAKERLEMAHRFNSGERDLFLISLKAGGTGLNLTGADTVILYDLWWNPAVEQQAADRAHRIGQKKTVQVIRLITRGTIEEKIYELQQKKQALFDQVIQPGEQMLTSLSEADLREILNMD